MEECVEITFESVRQHTGRQLIARIKGLILFCTIQFLISYLVGCYS